MLHVQRNEIALIENATSVGICFSGLAAVLQYWNRILTSRSKYVGNVFTFFLVAERTMVYVEVIPCNDSGSVDVYVLTEMFDVHVKSVEIRYVPINTAFLTHGLKIA